MPKHNYSAKEALVTLLEQIETASKPLAERIRMAINAGVDRQIEDASRSRMGRRRFKKRYYRKHVVYTDEEALAVAIAVLESHLVESRLLVGAACEEFKKVNLAPPMDHWSAEEKSDVLLTDESPDMRMPEVRLPGVDEPKKLFVESEPETVQEKKALPDFPFEPMGEEQLNGLRKIIDTLKRLSNFL